MTKKRSIGSVNIDRFDLETQKKVYELDYGREEKTTAPEQDQFRLRSISGIPDQNVHFITADLADGNKKNKDFFENSLKNKANFCVIRKDSDNCPVFMLPSLAATTDKTADETQGILIELFDKCYEAYAKDKNSPQPIVPKNQCAATTVAGAKSVGGNAHFVSMIKPPGKWARWNKLDPQLSFGGPQVFNTTQCGGYSSLIEGQAIKKYSSVARNNADIEPCRFQQWWEETKMKIKTWFAGSRNQVRALVEKDPNSKGTTYAEMADFNAQELADHFNNKENFLKHREDIIKKSNISTTHSGSEPISHDKSNNEDIEQVESHPKTFR